VIAIDEDAIKTLAQVLCLGKGRRASGLTKLHSGGIDALVSQILEHALVSVLKVEKRVDHYEWGGSVREKQSIILHKVPPT